MPLWQAPQYSEVENDWDDPECPLGGLGHMGTLPLHDIVNDRPVKPLRVGKIGFVTNFRPYKRRPKEKKVP